MIKRTIVKIISESTVMMIIRNSDGRGSYIIPAIMITSPDVM